MLMRVDVVRLVGVVGADLVSRSNDISFLFTVTEIVPTLLGEWFSACLDVSLLGASSFFPRARNRDLAVGFEAARYGGC